MREVVGRHHYLVDDGILGCRERAAIGFRSRGRIGLSLVALPVRMRDQPQTDRLLAEREVRGLECCRRLTNDPDVSITVDRDYAEAAIITGMAQHVCKRIETRVLKPYLISFGTVEILDHGCPRNVMNHEIIGSDAPEQVNPAGSAS